MRVDVSTRDGNLEAKRGNETSIESRLYDRYGNLAYNHIPGMTAAFSLAPGSEKYANITSSGSFLAGVASGKLSVTNEPGTVYCTVSVNPGLEANSMTITEASGASMVIKGYSKNAGYLETYYLWNKSKLERTNYSALTTTLLGADYGNVTVRDYLGGELLFNE